MSSRSADVGGRGTAWVVGQFALMAVVAGAWLLPPEPTAWLVAIGVTLAASGALFAGWGFRSLGRSLTPFPEPRRDGALVETGPFRLVRHPVYGGGLAFFAGLSLALGPVGLVPTAALALLWLGKTRAEERRLVARFPGYAAYQARVRRRFVPGVRR